MSTVLLPPKVNTWINEYKTFKTKEAALTSYNAIQKFLAYKKIEEKDWIKSMSSKNEKYHKVAELAKYISLEVEPASLKQYYNFWKSYLRFVYDMEFYNELAKTFIKLPKNIKRIREPLTHEIIKKLCKESDDVRKAEYLVLSSSGMRISEFLNSPKENFNLDTGIVQVAGGITKTQVERKTFISSEAIEAIEKVGDLFWEQRKYVNENQYFGKLRERVKLTERYAGSKMFKVNLHAFRSFTRTQAGTINQDFAEKLIGHSGYLGQYIRITDDDMKKYYEKLEPKLRIF